MLADDRLVPFDPVRFNPLNPIAIGSILRWQLEAQELLTFPLEQFSGAGLYALYYTGNRIADYSPIVDAFNQGRYIPLYVGKAEAGNSSYGYEPDYSAMKLHARIAKHANSLLEVEKFDKEKVFRLSDFRVRYLSLDDAWIVLGERALLREYRPVLWNTIANGFGSNPPGTARANARSVWDTVHPGRERAGLLPNRSLTLEEMRSRIKRGIEISLMNDEFSRDGKLRQLKNERPSVIWAPARKDDKDRRMRVFDERRFLREVDRLGIEVPRYRCVSEQEALFENEDLLSEEDQDTM
ncbi:Eco29kI family restriction endonuclease [Actinosynnema sp. NPDC053489]|uniref:Eco29kI family restriction endonuclease n=1 Tax=Actinosynnema sp. NPDC053489 TaxID=3363916 RepID=UPI0037C60974